MQLCACATITGNCCTDQCVYTLRALGVCSKHWYTSMINATHDLTNSRTVNALIAEAGFAHRMKDYSSQLKQSFKKKLLPGHCWRMSLTPLGWCRNPQQSPYTLCVTTSKGTITHCLLAAPGVQPHTISTIFHSSLNFTQFPLGTAFLELSLWW